MSKKCHPITLFLFTITPLWFDVILFQIRLTLFALILSVLKPGRSQVIPETQPIQKRADF
jgi:hypothetical protein